MKSLLTATLLGALLCSCGGNHQTGSTSAVADYSPRIGIAVTTGARTCLSIQNATLQQNLPVTLVFPGPSQDFQATNISGPSASPCPITKEVDPQAHSYDIAKAPAGMPKLTPVFAIVGPPGGVSVLNGLVQSDLDQNGKTETFRACGADDGIHLNVWRGQPLTGTVVWRGYYYEAGNPGTLPACTAAELPAATHQ